MPLQSDVSMLLFLHGPNRTYVLQRGHVKMNKEQLIQEIMKMLFQADEKQLKKLRTFIKAYLGLG